jgi:hypothetical protein
LPDFVEKAYGYHIPNKILKKIMNLMALEDSIETAKEKWINHFGEISYYR